MSAAAERQWVLCPRCGGKTRLQILRETELLLQHIDSEGSVFRMNHASNYLTLKGTLNQDKQALLQRIHSAMSGRTDLRPEYFRAL